MLLFLLMFWPVYCLLLWEEGLGANGGYIGNLEQAQAQCDGGLGCCSNEAIEVSFLIFTFFSFFQCMRLMVL